MLHTYRNIFVVSREQQRCAEADRDLQNIWDPQKDCGSFVNEKLCRALYVIRTLTSKANIII